MTSQHLADDIESFEGRRSRAYPDPLTHAAPWTIGVGHTGLDVHPGLDWSDKQIDATFAADIQKACDGLDGAIPWWRKLVDERQDVLADMAFQMGVHGVLQFRMALQAMKAGRFSQAAVEMLDSAWARQTPKRAQKLAEQMRTGLRS